MYSYDTVDAAYEYMNGGGKFAFFPLLYTDKESVLMRSVRVQHSFADDAPGFPGFFSSLSDPDVSSRLENILAHSLEQGQSVQEIAETLLRTIKGIVFGMGFSDAAVMVRPQGFSQKKLGPVWHCDKDEGEPYVFAGFAVHAATIFMNSPQDSILQQHIELRGYLSARKVLQDGSDAIECSALCAELSKIGSDQYPLYSAEEDAEGFVMAGRSFNCAVHTAPEPGKDGRIFVGISTGKSVEMFRRMVSNFIAHDLNSTEISTRERLCPSICTIS